MHFAMSRMMTIPLLPRLIDAGASSLLAMSTVSSSAVTAFNGPYVKRRRSDSSRSSVVRLRIAPPSVDGGSTSNVTAALRQPLPSSQLRWTCDPGQFDFQTTAELDDLEGLLGQARAQSAIEFGVNIKSDGYNLYVLGPSGSGKRTILKKYLETRAKDQPQPYDWAYINNFEQPDKPKALKLPAGLGQNLQQELVDFVEDMQVAIPAALETDEHQLRIELEVKEILNDHERTVDELVKDAEKVGLVLVRTPTGMALISRSDRKKKEGEQELQAKEKDPLPSKKEQNPLPPKKKQDIAQAIKELEPKMDEIARKFPQLKKQGDERIKELNKHAAKDAIQFLISPLKTKYADLPDVVSHLEAIEAHVIEHSDQIRSKEEEDPALSFLRGRETLSFERYKINLIVDNTETNDGGAPVIFEDYPYYSNLIGRVEYANQMGSLVTDFSLIKAGALHRANGGYLVLRARDLLMKPYSWEALKRALGAGEVRIESLGAELGLINTVSLQPEPIEIDVKVVLLGDRMLYYLLQTYDPDFDHLFKVAADFNDEMDRSEEACRLYARMIASLSKTESVKPMDPEAVAAMLEQAARHVGDQEKLSTHIRSSADLLRESDYWAGVGGADAIGAQHVRKAISEQIYRGDRIRELIQEAIRRGTLLVDVTGSRVAQVNGLSVMMLGKLAFGRPSRITATTRLGRGKVVDIEREAELGGSTHSKGVMILSSLLGSRYARDCPLSLSASLVFEQSYGMVDGDSASMAELCVLLSDLSGLPIRQGLAITGSLNQHGEAQPIGGATEKIEGFYDVCHALGLTGDQGVLIPAQNAKNLMLRPDLLDAVDQGKFAVYTYENVNDAVEILMGIEAGERGAGGKYAPGTVNFLVDSRLREMANLLREFSQDSDDKT